MYSYRKPAGEMRVRRHHGVVRSMAGCLGFPEGSSFEKPEVVLEWKLRRSE